ncbi:hypothetical protein C8R44DRAFT_370842 [Mycena epipterygia]|nr:hypothetical protein C8R44DRAFT_370842 [Mycena epipterygia]
MDSELQLLLATNCAPTAGQRRAIRNLLDAGDAELQRLSDTVSALSLVVSELKRQISERSVSLAALRGTLSAIRRYPPEILGHIFVFCRDDSEENYRWLITDPRHPPILLGQVCSYWRRVAHSTPRLWNRVYLPVASDVSKRTAPLLRQIFKNSGSLPLYLQLSTWSAPLSFSDGDDEMWAIVWNAHLRLEHLRINVNRRCPVCPFPRDTLFPLLCSLDLYSSNGTTWTLVPF